jgi:predicted transcriptional regulator of viral defense system
MSRRSALVSLSPLAAEQWGMVTAAQARDLGVSRLDLTRLVNDGTFERIEPGAGVYRLTGSPPDPDLDAIRAAWLQLGPDPPASQRLRDPDSIVSHRSAAVVLHLGDLLPDKHEFYSPVRRRLRRDDVRIHVYPDLTRIPWTTVHGLPVTTARRTIADLLHDREDESAVARITQDSIRAGLLTEGELAEAVRGHSSAYGSDSDSTLAHTLAGSTSTGERE